MCCVGFIIVVVVALVVCSNPLLEVHVNVGG